MTKNIVEGLPFCCSVRPYFASNLHRRSIFLRENGAGLLGFAILDSNKVE
jgi:hypothetical protein